MEELFKRYETKVVEIAEANKQRDLAIQVVLGLKSGELSLDQIEAHEGGFRLNPLEAVDAAS